MGTSSIKVVELSTWAGRKKLENYGEISASVLYKKQFRTFEKNTLLLSSKEVSRALKAIIEEAGIETQKVTFSIPDFSTFFTTFKLPPMTKEEVPQAVKTEARQHIPLPFSEVVVDWQILNPYHRSEEEEIAILLVAVPHEVINQYQHIATSLGLELLALEAEVFALKRALVSEEEKETMALVDIGARSTSCSIIEKGSLTTSRSFDVSGNSLTERVSKGLSVDYEKAEELKSKYGLMPSTENGKDNQVREILIPLIDLIVKESESVIRNFSDSENKKVEKVIICGGTALIPGLESYLKSHFQEEEVEVANPFSHLYFPPILEETLKGMGPAYAVAVGIAERGLE